MLDQTINLVDIDLFFRLHFFQKQQEQTWHHSKQLPAQ